MGVFTLGAELNKAVVSFDAAALALRSDPSSPDRQDEMTHAAVEAFAVVVKIAALHSSSMLALQLKALALRHLFNAVPSSRPDGIEQRRLCQQIIDGLLAAPAIGGETNER